MTQHSALPPRWMDLRVSGRLVGKYSPALRKLELFYRGERALFHLDQIDATIEQTSEPREPEGVKA